MSKIKLESKDDYLALFKTINQPLREKFSSGFARIKFGQNGVGYGTKIAEMEGFSRLLWGAAPAIRMLDDSWQQQLIQGIIHGTNPNHTEYWGDIQDRDQRMVEMPAIALALLHGDHFIWKHLSTAERKKVLTWLSQIFDYECADGNWQFFKVIVALVFQELGHEVDATKYALSLEKIEACYLDDGWYKDSSRGRQDYYTPFAFHYYGLIYSRLVPKAPLSAVFKERAWLFAKEYLHFFAEDGANVPFGRSMIYRYAVSAFWSAAVYANLLPYELAVMKGLINRNLEWWLSKNIFDGEGLLNLGYTYPQLSITEPYNSALSPYWSNKIFLLLALPDEHPYWHTAQTEMPACRPTQKLLTQANMLAVHDKGHTQLLNAGQPGPNYHTLSNEKYLKFAYSSQFGFSIPRSNQSKEETAMDSMIGLQTLDRKTLISQNQQTVEAVGPFLIRNKVTNITLNNQAIASTWQVTDSKSVRTWLLALDGWQLRIHQINLDEPAVIYETGFAVENTPEKLGDIIIESNNQYFEGKKGFSGIADLSVTDTTRSHTPVNCLPNTNLMTYEMTCLPGLETILDEGIHWLVTGIFAHQDIKYAKEQWRTPPAVTLNQNEWIIARGAKQIILNLSEGQCMAN
ncbi:hypothetical protein IGI37_002233 [Enterococcus sp. AZ194]|uniref:DUF2264 domain-containing protein n=1 Tax=Enterococcus sp. AZ194 TaxID=2774629 RepID=UPI003F202867